MVEQQIDSGSKKRSLESMTAAERGQGAGWDEGITKKLNAWAEKLFS